jgi:hypothetical protein
MLNRCGLERFADLCEQRIARSAVGLAGTNLDQFVAVEAGCNFVDDVTGKAFVTDENDRVQSVSAGTQATPLGRCEIEQGNPPTEILG